MAVQIGSLDLKTGAAVAEGKPWEGVRNCQARSFLREMEIGGLRSFSLSQSVVGVVEVISTSHADATTAAGRAVSAASTPSRAPAATARAR